MNLQAQRQCLTVRGFQPAACLRTSLDPGKANLDLHLAVTTTAELHIQRQLCLLHLEPQLLASPSSCAAYNSRRNSINASASVIFASTAAPKYHAELAQPEESACPIRHVPRSTSALIHGRPERRHTHKNRVGCS